MKFRASTILLLATVCSVLISLADTWNQTVTEPVGDNISSAEPMRQRDFRMRGRIIYIRSSGPETLATLVVESSEHGELFFCPPALLRKQALKPGFSATVSGLIRSFPQGWEYAAVTNCTDVTEGPPPVPVQTTISDLLDGRFDFRLTRFTGTLRDVSLSETFPGWIILVVCSQRDRIFISVPDAEGQFDRFSQLIGRRVRATGICVPSDPTPRLKIGRTFKVSTPNDVIAETAPDEADQNIPSIDDIRTTRESEILSLGYHAATGQVIAVWQHRHVLLRQPNGSYSEISLAQPDLPEFGMNIRAVGLPESDLFHINLSYASWSRLDSEWRDLPAPLTVTPQNIISEKNGYEVVNSRFHGLPIRLTGIVRSLPDDGSNQLHLESCGRMVIVDASATADALTGISVGCTVSVSGTCVILHEKRSHAASFPRLKDFILVVRTPDDISVLARPSWWTSGRLVTVICILFAGLLGILIWNSALRRLATRKGRELMREQIGRVKAALKTEERTRLAVELHDSLAQNLTGVSLEIDTADRLADEDREAMHMHLSTAARALKSCRDELRNCLWDLRNHALEAASMDDAIRQTLAPHLPGIELSVRFSVPRSRMPDDIVHAILRIIRELALNGVRHGHATKVRIAGSMDGERLLFSVSDNGTGFDPKTAPGFAKGHYGLVGIRERVNQFEGEFSLTSAPGTGTKAVVTFALPKNEGKTI